MVVVVVGLTAVGLLLLGVHFLRSGYPGWAGLTGVVLGAAALIGLALILIVRPGPEPMFVVEFLAFIGILCIGIMLVRRRDQRLMEAALEASKADGIN